ncbi:TLC domain-containing protein [Trichophaea hybrida]|nr:TLC domain-containing protein [Trichophaea hybrida]
MHTPIPENSGLYGERTNGDVALSSGAENHRNPETRRSVKGSRRKPTATDEPPARQKRKIRPAKATPGFTDGAAAFLVRNQIRMSLSLILTLAATHVSFPHLRPTLRKFYEVSYFNPVTGLYGKGIDDLYLVFFWIVLFTFLRSTILDYVFVPLARLGGINTKKGVVRFSEQAWLVVYYGSFWGVGMYLMYNSPYWFNMEEFWTDYPVHEVSGLFKWYYLAQFAFWLQQIFVLNIEEWRKDHWQMFAHHIITCALVSASYTHHLTRVGHAILCVMDVIDIMLSIAKLLKYLGYSTICDYAFGLFLVGWIAGRHGAYNMITYSVITDSLRVIKPGCYIRNTFTFKTDVVCFSKPVQRCFIVLLVGLQIITLVWLYMILKVAYRVVTGAGADDTRSEDEADDDDEEVDEMDEKTRQLSNGGAAAKKAVTTNGTATATKSMNGNGHPRSHLLSQPLGGD